MRSKSAIKNLFSTLFLQFITIVCGFIVPRLIIQQYGSSINGLIESILQFLSYISLLQAGFGPVVKSVLYKPILDKDNKTISNVLYSSQKFFRKILLVFIVYLLFLIICYPLFMNSEFDRYFTIGLIIILSISTFVEYFFGITYSLFLDAAQKKYIISYIQLSTLIINTIFTIVLIKFGSSIHIVKFVGALVYVLRPILLYSYVKKKYSINLKEADKNYDIKQKWDGFAQHVASVIHTSTDITVITIFTNLVEVSVYAVYNLVVKGMRNVVAAVTGSFSSGFGELIAMKNNEKLTKVFNTYEFIYHTFSSIIFTCALVLIIPFISVYTKDITDANYIRPLFGFLIIMSEYMNTLKNQYSSITLAAGHFKETRKGAWVEAFTNIILSVILVFKFGIVGVAIGTLVAMSIRMVEFIYHSSKYILKRSIYISFSKVSISIIETILLYFIFTLFNFSCNSLIEFIILGAIVFIAVSIIITTINSIIYRGELKNTVGYFKRRS